MSGEATRLRKRLRPLSSGNTFIRNPGTDVSVPCGVCSRKFPTSRLALGRCPACAWYLRTHGIERPPELFARTGFFSGDHQARYFSRVAMGPLDECWPWLGSTKGSGYGALRVDGTHTWAHRYAYEFWTGPIPDGLTIDHLCFNRACQNPAHLAVVTRGENTRRALERRYAA